MARSIRAVRWDLVATVIAVAVVACSSGTIAGGGTNTSSSSGVGAAAGGMATGGGVTATTSAGGGTAGGGGTVAPPFTCLPEVATSPALKALVHLDPAEPHPGDTLTVIVRSTNGTKPPSAPKLVMQAVGAKGTVVEQTTMKAGGGDTLYYFAIPDVQLGDICLLGLIDGATPEIAAKVTVTARPPGPPLVNGVYKVI